VEKNSKTLTAQIDRLKRLNFEEKVFFELAQ